MALEASEQAFHAPGTGAPHHDRVHDPTNRPETERVVG